MRVRVAFINVSNHGCVGNTTRALHHPRRGRGNPAGGGAPQPAPMNGGTGAVCYAGAANTIIVGNRAGENTRCKLSALRVAINQIT